MPNSPIARTQATASADARPGADIGKARRRKRCQGDAPSVRPASRISFGTAANAERAAGKQHQDLDQQPSPTFGPGQPPGHRQPQGDNNHQREAAQPEGNGNRAAVAPGQMKPMPRRNTEQCRKRNRQQQQRR
ncbi:hypothetical protein BBAD15_g302 [Beauveria bassiana D1-5]|uniref:Uncharacterized protein n=1 Tax=Beauveria bassiana D1-5 TaxID=1245745 RepID=A0A0A2W0Y9_BEABA|nr:hypothetical protein BBAD15_g302 [Beauveria bassiana D1-5]